MKGKLKEIFNKEYTNIIIIFVFALLISIPTIKMNFINTHDGLIHIQRIILTEFSMKNQNSIPYVLEKIYDGNGGAVNLFYQPFTTFVPFFIRTIINSYEAALNIFVFLIFFISGVSVYALSKEITKNRTICLMSGLLYMYMPYIIQNVYIRFALGEFAAMSFVPLVFLGLFNLFYGDGTKKHWLLIGAILLVLTHTITTIYTIIFSIIIVLINIMKIDKEKIKLLVVYALLILGITMFFWGPLVEYKNFTQYVIFNENIMGTSSKRVEDRALELKELFLKPHDSILKYNIEIPFIIVIASVVLIIKEIKKNFNKNQIVIYIELFVALILSYFMTTKYFPWEFMPNVLRIIQFPWRMIGFANIFLSIICSINIYYLIKIIVETIKEKLNKKDNKTINENIINIFCIIIAISLCVYTSTGIYRFIKSDDYKYDSCNNTDIKADEYYYIIDDKETLKMGESNTEYLPLKAFVFKMNVSNGTEEQRKEGSVIIKGEYRITEDKSNNLNRNIKVEDVKQGDILETSLFYYPGYEIIIKTKDKEIKQQYEESKIGRIQITFEEDCKNADITVKYVGTIFEKGCLVISILTSIMLVGYVIIKKEKR